MQQANLDESDSTSASTLILEGIVLTDSEEKYFFKRINRLHALFPFDTLIELTFHQDHSYPEIYGKLKITTMECTFKSEHLGLELYQLYEELRLETESQIRKWYQDWPMNRIGEVYYSMMNNETTWRM